MRKGHKNMERGIEMAKWAISYFLFYFVFLIIFMHFNTVTNELEIIPHLIFCVFNAFVAIKFADWITGV